MQGDGMHECSRCRVVTDDVKTLGHRDYCGGCVLAVWAEQREELAKLRAELADRDTELASIRRHLGGHPSSQLDGANGLAQATYSAMRRAEADRDALQAKLAEAQEERDNLQRRFDRDQTHSEKCWQWHLGCAHHRLARIESERDCHEQNHESALQLLEVERTRADAAVQLLRDFPDDNYQSEDLPSWNARRLELLSQQPANSGATSQSVGVDEQAALRAFRRWYVWAVAMDGPGEENEAAFLERLKDEEVQ